MSTAINLILIRYAPSPVAVAIQDGDATSAARITSASMHRNLRNPIVLTPDSQQRHYDQKRQIAGRGDNAHTRRRVGTGIAGGEMVSRGSSQAALN